MARREKKKVELVDGNLRLEIKQPETLLKVASGNGKTDGVESQYMTYTAITCDPDDFTACGYKVRQIRDRDPVQKFERRSTELFICMTMCSPLYTPGFSARDFDLRSFAFTDNEDEKLFVRTFTSVVKVCFFNGVPPSHQANTDHHKTTSTEYSTPSSAKQIQNVGSRLLEEVRSLLNDPHTSA